MRRRICRSGGVLLGFALSLSLFVPAHGEDHKKNEAIFKYAGGTESIGRDCVGKLEVYDDGLVFRCPQGSITAPFSSITLMQFRPDLSRKVRRMKMKWKVRPYPRGGKTNRYFTAVYHEEGQAHAFVLEVEPLAMRPYLAEIDLRAGKRIEVKGSEKYY